MTRFLPPPAGLLFLLLAGILTLSDVPALVSIVWANYGAVRLLQGEVGPSGEALGASLRVNPDNARASIMLGRLQVRAGDYSRGIAHLERALAQPSQPDPFALHDLGRAYQATGQPERAIVTWQQAPAIGYFLIQDGTRYLEGEEPARAVTSFDTALRVAFDNPVIASQAYYGRATALLTLDQTGAAIDALKRATQVDPGNEDAFDLLVSIYSGQGDYANASYWDFQMAESLDDERRLLHLARAHLWVGEYNEVEHYIRLYLLEVPQSAYARRLLCDAYVGAGRLREALPVCQEAAHLASPPSASQYLKLGDLLVQVGHLDGARDAFEAALRIDPTYQPALDALENMIP